jgi:hypothetical protein
LEIPITFTIQLLVQDFLIYQLKKYTFHYQAGTFEQYWSDYLSSTANAIRSTIESKGSKVISAIKKDAQEIANKFTDNNNGLIQFHGTYCLLQLIHNGIIIYIIIYISS